MWEAGTVPLPPLQPLLYAQPLLTTPAASYVIDFLKTQWSNSGGGSGTEFGSCTCNRLSFLGVPKFISGFRLITPLSEIKDGHQAMDHFNVSQAQNSNGIYSLVFCKN